MKIIIIMLVMSFNAYAQVKYISTINSLNMKKSSDSIMLMKDDIQVNVKTDIVVDEDLKIIIVSENDTTSTTFKIDDVNRQTSNEVNVITYMTSIGDIPYGFLFFEDYPIIVLTFPSDNTEIFIVKTFQVTDMKVKNFDTDY